MGGGSTKEAKKQQDEIEKRLDVELARIVSETHFELLTPQYVGKKLEDVMQLRLSKEQQALVREHIEQVLNSHFRNKYKIYEILGKGGYSVVHSCVKNDDQSTHAVKIIDKQKLSKNALKSLKEEIATMKALSHPRLIALRDVFDHGSTMYLVIEKVEGGELFDEIVRLQKYNEKIAAEIMYNFLDGLKYMHDLGYVHRDIKPENILLLTKPQHPQDICSELKIADFGFAAKVGEEETLKTCCGTPRYISPEVLNAGLFQKIKGYGKTCDMWATGVIAYILLFGKAPFYHRDRNQLWHHITNGIWALPPEADKLSPEAVDFIQNLIVVDRRKRFTVTEAINHPFIVDRNKTKEDHLETALVNLAEFNAKEKFKAAVFGIQSLSRVAYIKKCLDLGVKANTGLIKSMDNGELGDDTTHLDLTRNYVGTKGLCAVLEMINEGCPNLRSVTLSGCNVNNSVITLLVDVASKHPKLSSIDLSNNPLSYKAGTMLLQLAKTNPRIKELKLDNTKVQEGILRQIDTQLEYNRTGRLKDYFAKRSASESSPRPETKLPECAPVKG
eukprot:TRINITY_DN5703_c0_g2_i1.p1 TRINITY_DN5703_c0_g2~~TRINITY_DN5703_c0_g2_i1.p1  ORF type:complete len:558 (+),score=158.70 TRINITY_DN5703_c0_g2_i1:484-2157(+)